MVMMVVVLMMGVLQTSAEVSQYEIDKGPEQHKLLMLMMRSMITVMVLMIFILSGYFVFVKSCALGRFMCHCVILIFVRCFHLGEDFST